MAEVHVIVVVASVADESLSEFGDIWWLHGGLMMMVIFKFIGYLM